MIAVIIKRLVQSRMEEYYFCRLRQNAKQLACLEMLVNSKVQPFGIFTLNIFRRSMRFTAFKNLLDKIGVEKAVSALFI